MGAAAGIRHSMEPLEQSRYCFRRYADSCISNSKLGEVSGEIQADRNFSIEGKFEGVGDQIQNNLLPHVAINIDRLAQVGAIHHQIQTCFLRGGSEYTR